MAENNPDRVDPPFFLRPVLNAISGKRGVQVYMKLASPVDRFLIPATGGWLSTAPGQQVCVIEHKGAKSGKKRRTPVGYMRDGQNVVIVASYGGSQRHPAWYHNLKANPRVRLWARKARSGWYTAHIAGGEERERLWDAVTRFYPGFAKYQTYTDRQIQLFVLTPALTRA
ncbi:MAG TPA: nitroreductase family deazaflavin-dependent oxidoreductase [Dehalococcoidia bacterium]|nr:nitroreductase family deazaflavin-dependent oxidoreductase [Dehalococcoidia bacterium]